MGTYRHYEDEFKKKIVEIAEEYGLSKNTVNNWIKRYKNTSSFRAEGIRF